MLSGVALADEGNTDPHGGGLSLEMLKVAEQTGVYSTRAEIDRTSLAQDIKEFDAAFAWAVFGYGPSHLEHLLLLKGMTKPDGLVMLTVNGYGWIDMYWGKSCGNVVSINKLKLQEVRKCKS